MREQTEIKVLIADQYAIVRNGLRFSLLAADDIAVVGETARGDEMLTLCRDLEPHVVILDVVLLDVDGIRVTHMLQNVLPNVRVLIVTACDDCALIQAAMQSGAAGILSKDASPSEIIAAVRATSLGLFTLAQRAFETLLDGDAAGKTVSISSTNTANSRLCSYEAQNAGSHPIFVLTLREREILKFVLLGYTSAEIGYRLFISHRTVEKHRSNIMHKLNVLNQAELIALAYRLGMMPSEETLAESRKSEREPSLNLFSFRVSERKPSHLVASDTRRAIVASK